MRDGNVIQMRGECDVRNVREHHAMILDALRDRDDLGIDASGVEHADITFVQLLVSAAKTGEAARKRVRLVAVSDPLRAAFARAGLGLSPSNDQITWA